MQKTITLITCLLAFVTFANLGATGQNKGVQRRGTGRAAAPSRTADDIFDLLASGDVTAEKIKELLGRNPSLANARDKQGMTPLHLAVDDVDIVKVLLANRADVNARTGDFQKTPLHMAADSFGDAEKIRGVVELLIANKADINAKDSEGETPLHKAAFINRHEVIRALITRGADVNARDNAGWTPLHTAVLQGSKEAVEVLLANNADVNATTKDGYTPLYLIKKYVDTIELLRKQGAKETFPAGQASGERP